MKEKWDATCGRPDDDSVTVATRRRKRTPTDSNRAWTRVRLLHKSNKDRTAARTSQWIDFEFVLYISAAVRQPCLVHRRTLTDFTPSWWDSTKKMGHRSVYTLAHTKKNTVVFIFLLVPSSLVHITAANTNTHSTNSPIIISLDTDLFPRSLFFIFIFFYGLQKKIYNITERKSMGKMCIFCCYSANESFFFRTTFSEVGYATWIGLNKRELHTALTEKNVNEFESFSFMQKCTFFSDVRTGLQW